MAKGLKMSHYDCNPGLHFLGILTMPPAFPDSTNKTLVSSEFKNIYYHFGFVQTNCKIVRYHEIGYISQYIIFNHNNIGTLTNDIRQWKIFQYNYHRLCKLRDNNVKIILQTHIQTNKAPIIHSRTHQEVLARQYRN